MCNVHIKKEPFPGTPPPPKKKERYNNKKKLLKQTDKNMFVHKSLFVLVLKLT